MAYADENCSTGRRISPYFTATTLPHYPEAIGPIARARDEPQAAVRHGLGSSSVSEIGHSGQIL